MLDLGYFCISIPQFCISLVTFYNVVRRLEYAAPFSLSTTGNISLLHFSVNLSLNSLNTLPYFFGCSGRGTLYHLGHYI